MTTINGIGGLRSLVGEHLGYSDWVEVTQDRINRFADATEDHQWIHVDVDRAQAGPFGGPIAHGYLTLSLAARFAEEVVQVTGISMGINYGLNKVRFPSPVPAGSRLHAGVKVLAVDDVAGGAQATMEMTIETEDASKPACVAEILFRYYE